MSILPSDVRRSINAQLPKELGQRLEAITRKNFEKIKLEMIQDFDSHPVTQEIEAGPNAPNTSRTLSGYGNLFTFIGFPSGADPIQEIRERLEETILRKINFKNGRMSFITTEPTREELFKMTKISSFRPELEGGRSWLDGIETGLSGLGFYLYKEDGDIKGSRSGPAIQLKGGKKSEKAVGGGSTGGAIATQRTRYTRTSYISTILKEFSQKVSNLERLRIR
jgi:hypothetical protein